MLTSRTSGVPVPAVDGGLARSRGRRTVLRENRSGTRNSLSDPVGTSIRNDRDSPGPVMFTVRRLPQARRLEDHAAGALRQPACRWIAAREPVSHRKRGSETVRLSAPSSRKAALGWAVTSRSLPSLPWPSSRRPRRGMPRTGRRAVRPRPHAEHRPAFPACPGRRDRARPAPTPPTDSSRRTHPARACGAPAGAARSARRCRSPAAPGIPRRLRARATRAVHTSPACEGRCPWSVDVRRRRPLRARSPPVAPPFAVAVSCRGRARRARSPPHAESQHHEDHKTREHSVAGERSRD